MPKNIEVWTIGRMAAEHGFNPLWALNLYAGKRHCTRDQNEIFVDGYENVNRDYAESLDRAAA
jgi:hypothetical protein